MKGRLFACLLLSSSVFVIPALAQQGGGGGGSPSQGQPSDDHRGRQGGQSTEDINSALQDYEQRMSRNLDQCRHELDQMKKELHELIDLRIKMAMSLAESRAKMQPQGTGLAAGRPGGAYGSSRNDPGSQSQGGATGHGASSALAGELQQLHNQLRSEVDQQQNQVAQLVGQLRSLQQRQSQGHEQQGNAQGQGQREQSQGGNQGGQRSQQGQQQRQGQQPGQQNNKPAREAGRAVAPAIPEPSASAMSRGQLAHVESLLDAPFRVAIRDLSLIFQERRGFDAKVSSEGLDMLASSPRFRLRSSETVDSAIPVSAASVAWLMPRASIRCASISAAHGPSRVMRILVLLDELAEDRDVIELLGVEGLALATFRQPGQHGKRRLVLLLRADRAERELADEREIFGPGRRRSWMVEESCEGTASVLSVKVLCGSSVDRGAVIPSRCPCHSPHGSGRADEHPLSKKISG